MSLIETTRKLAHNRKASLTVAQLCKEVGVSVRWYYKLMAGEHDRLSVEHVQKLHDYLARKRRK